MRDRSACGAQVQGHFGFSETNNQFFFTRLHTEYNIKNKECIYSFEVFLMTNITFTQNTFKNITKRFLQR